MIFADGVSEFAIVYRINDRERSDWKRLVCGKCVEEHEATDPMKVTGHFKCEQCGSHSGEALSQERAEDLLARICPATAQKRRNNTKQP